MMSIAVVHTADDALQALREHTDELARWQTSALNESDTRSKIIDALLLQILGWDEASITREDRTANGKYRDYVVRNERTAFVLEAKRAVVTSRCRSSPLVRRHGTGFLRSREISKRHWTRLSSTVVNKATQSAWSRTASSSR